MGRITGRDYDKIFKSRKLGQKLEPPKYELLTDEEISQLRAEIELKSQQKLKMPPLLQQREDIENVLAVNPEIQGFDTSKYIFTDITFGLTDRVRLFYQSHLVIDNSNYLVLMVFRNVKLL